MVWIPGGSFLMGSADFYPEERPVRRVEVDGFWMDDHPVTVAEFRRFVTATGYVTVAERSLDAAQYPGADPALLRPGSLVFHPTSGPVDLRDVSQWWSYVPGTQWRRPQGPRTSAKGLGNHPVTHVAAEDAEAYAPRNPRVTSAQASLAPGEPGAHIPRRVTKGGSHLCAPNYCLRYRPAARQPQAIDTSTCHLGFRCILRDASGERDD